jgi:hypothetical protein
VRRSWRVEEKDFSIKVTPDDFKDDFKVDKESIMISNKRLDITLMLVNLFFGLYNLYGATHNSTLTCAINLKE